MSSTTDITINEDNQT